MVVEVSFVESFRVQIQCQAAMAVEDLKVLEKDVLTLTEFFRFEP